MMLLLGGTGLLGGNVLKRLREDRLPVRLVTRGSRDWQDSAVHDIRQKGADFLIADATDLASLSKAAAGCSAIINLVGNMPPKLRTDMHALHVTVAENVLAVAREHKIQRVVQVSCLGANPNAPGNYFKTRFEADRLVAESDVYWTIIKASYIFSDDEFPFLEALMPLIKFKLFLPILGSGQNEMQPVHVDDVASCIVKAIHDKETSCKTLELAGPELYTMQFMMERARKFLRLSGAAVNIPTDSASRTADALARFIPRASINTELLQLLSSDSVAEHNDLESYYKSTPISLEDHFDDIISAL